MRTAHRWTLWLYAGLLMICLLGTGLVSGCGFRTGAQQENEESILVQRLLGEKEEQQMRLARIESRLSSLEEAVNMLQTAQIPAQPNTQAAATAPQPVATAPQAPASASSGSAYPVSDPSAGQMPGQATGVPAAAPQLVTVPTSPQASGVSATAAQPRRRAPAIPPAYQQALDLLLQANKPEESRTAFSIFLTDNPNHPLTPNVLYWVGETYYSEKKYDDAILLFKDVAARFGEHAKAPDALLKAAMAYRHLGDAENAAYLEQLLLKDYPNSRSAGILRQRGG